MASSFHLEDRNGHSRGKGLPLTEALGQPHLRDQACLRKDCHIIGGHGLEMVSDRQEAGIRGPGFHRGSLGHPCGRCPVL